MRKRVRFILFIVAIAAIASVGYGIMHLLTYVFPVSEDNTGTNVLYTLVLIALGLTIPYWMLKLMAFAAHERNPEERNLHLKDIPKDKDELAHDS